MCVCVCCAYPGADPDFEVGGVMGMAVGHSPRGSGGMLPRKKFVNQR